MEAGGNNRSVFIIMASKPTPAITDGILPEAKRRGLAVILLTDKYTMTMNAYKNKHYQPNEIICCDVFDPFRVIDMLLSKAIKPLAVFSNSDYLQATTSIVADYFGCCAKDWALCFKAKNKRVMRDRMTQLQLPNILYGEFPINALNALPIPYPLIIKPTTGVASEQVCICFCRDDIQRYLEGLGKEVVSLYIEQYVEGPLISVETLGDGNDIHVISSFETVISAPPLCIEEQALLGSPLSERYKQQCLEQLEKFGVGFGFAHSEFVISQGQPVLIEINYRCPGDGKEFLLDACMPDGLFKTLVSLYCGEPLVKNNSVKGQGGMKYFVAEQSGIITGIEKESMDVKDSESVTFSPLIGIADSISVTGSNRDYLGILTVRSNSCERAAELLLLADKAIRFTIQ